MEPPELTLLSGDTMGGSSDTEFTKEAIAVAMAANLRERASADALVLRARNMVAFASGLVVAAQVALVTSLGKEVADKPIIDGGETWVLAGLGGAAGLFLLGAFVFLVVRADSPKKQDMVTEESIGKAFDASPSERMEFLLADVTRELKAWPESNETRRRQNRWLALISGLAVAASIVQLVLLIVLAGTL